MNLENTAGKEEMREPVQTFFRIFPQTDDDGRP